MKHAMRHVMGPQYGSSTRYPGWPLICGGRRCANKEGVSRGGVGQAVLTLLRIAKRV